MLKEQWAVALLRVFLVVLFGVLVIFQVMSLPGQFAHMAKENPDEAYLRWPLTAITVFWVLCVQVVVGIGRVVGESIVSHGTIQAEGTQKIEVHSIGHVGVAVGQATSARGALSTLRVSSQVAGLATRATLDVTEHESRFRAGKGSRSCCVTSDALTEWQMAEGGHEAGNVEICAAGGNAGVESGGGRGECGGL